jgi:hypothetical protein
MICRRATYHQWKSSNLATVSRTKCSMSEVGIAPGGKASIRERWPEVAILLVGALLWCVTRTQPKLLDPFHTEWLLKGDWSATWHGWLFFVKGPWHVPPGVVPELLAPYGTSVFYTNSVFWLAVPGKLFALVTDREFQFYGWFLVSSFAGLALFPWWFLGRLGAGPVLRVAGGLLVMADPMIPARFGHMPMTAQWLIVAQVAVALLLVLAPADPRRLMAISLSAALFAFWTDGYIAAMGIPLFAANVVLAVRQAKWPWREAAVSFVVLAVGAALALWLVGAFLPDKVNRTAEGFGDFSADLGTLVNPHVFSRWIPGFSMGPRQGEGFSYLGLGALLLTVVTVPLVAQRWRSLPRVLLALLPFLVIVLGEAIYAASARVTFAGRTLFEAWKLFELLGPLPSMFRTSGRFVWPLHYLVILGALAVVARRPAKAWAFMVCGCAAIQLAEIPARPNEFDPPPPLPTLSPAWTGLRGAYRHLELLPVQVQWVCGYNEGLVTVLSRVAAREGLTINSGLVGRVPAAIPERCNARHTGPVAPDTIYVVDPPSYASDLHGAKCGVLDGIPVCVADGTKLADQLSARVP